MGASKDGRMSVRDKIEMVLHSCLADEEDDPPDANQATTGGGTSDESRIDASVPTRLSGSGGDSPALVSKSLAVRCRTSGNSPHSSSSCPSPLRNCEPLGGAEVVIRSSNAKGGVACGDGVINEREHSQKRVDGCRGIPEEEDNRYKIFHTLLAHQLKIIQGLQDSLKNKEAEREALCKDRDQLEEKLNSERQQNAEFKSQTESSLQQKDELIQELERQLAVIDSHRPTEHKETCVTPPPPPSFTPELATQHVEMLDDDGLGPPLPKRTKLDVGRDETLLNNFMPPLPSKKSYMPTHLSARSMHQPQPRRSDSPPRLSPAVTPRSTPNTSGRPREIRSYLGEEMHNDSMVVPPDEFQDELERINQGTPADGLEDKSIDNQVDGDDQYSDSFSFRAQKASTSASSNRSKYPFNFQDGKKRLASSNNSPFLPINKARLQYPPPSDIVSKANALPRGQFDIGIRNRSNNFLNLSRPLAKKAPVVLGSPTQSQTTPSTSSSSHFRSLDGHAAASSSLASSQSYHSPYVHYHHPREEDQAMVPSVTPPTAKKRRVGRPPGSTIKSKLLAKGSPSSFTSPSSGSGTPAAGQIPNGTMGSQEPACPPPQRFSQRGRLLKPNRARYSPDPDISVSITPREKFVTTKRGYFVGEPFVQPGFTAEDEEGALHRHTESSYQFSTPTPPRGREDEEDPFLLSGPDTETSKSKFETLEDGSMTTTAEGGASLATLIEVPIWRVNDFESMPEVEVFPDDDMSEEAFLKRHQKLEAKEKQRKRWDSQRMREESYLERLKRKQEEREHQKELRRLQRKRNKGRNGANEEESVTPSVEEIKAIHIGTELPVGAFGHPLPLVEKVDFKLMWSIAPEAVTATVSSSTPAPLTPRHEITLQNDENAVFIEGIVNEKRNTPVPESMETFSCLPSRSTTPSTVPPSSSPSSSSLSLLSMSSCGKSSLSPTPPIVDPVYEGDEVCINVSTSSQIENTTTPATVSGKGDEVGNGMLTAAVDETFVILEKGHDEKEPKPLEENDGSRECAPSSPVFTVDLVDYVNSEPESEDDKNEEDDGDGKEDDSKDSSDICDNVTNPSSATPSISIPLQALTSLPSSSSPKRASPLELNTSTSITASNNSNSSSPPTSSRTKDSRQSNSTVVRFPQMMSFPTSVSLSSSKVTSSFQSITSSSSSTVSKTSITFFIPNNPLAPRHQRSSTASSMHVDSKSSSSSITPAVVPTSSDS